MADALDAAPARIAAARAGGFGLFVARRADVDEGWLAADELVRDDGPLGRRAARASAPRRLPLASY